METKNVIYELRTGKGMSQDELAEKLFVTRQAVSRWENGETVPNTETLKLLSKLFDVSINTLLGSPRQLICQCCGMPLEEASLSREPDGAINEDYCKWCYANGKICLYEHGQTHRLLRGAHGKTRQWPCRARCAAVLSAETSSPTASTTIRSEDGTGNGKVKNVKPVKKRKNDDR